MDDESFDILLRSKRTAKFDGLALLLILGVVVFTSFGPSFGWSGINFSDSSLYIPFLIICVAFAGTFFIISHRINNVVNREAEKKQPSRAQPRTERKAPKEKEVIIERKIIRK